MPDLFETHICTNLTNSELIGQLLSIIASIFRLYHVNCPLKSHYIEASLQYIISQ